MFWMFFFSVGVLLMLKTFFFKVRGYVAQQHEGDF